MLRPLLLTSRPLAAKAWNVAPIAMLTLALVVGRSLNASAATAPKPSINPAPVASPAPGAGVAARSSTVPATNTHAAGTGEIKVVHFQLATGSPSIPGLSFSTPTPEFVDQSQGKDFVLDVTIQGKFIAPESSLTIGRRQLPVGPDGSFRTQLRLRLPVSTIGLTAISPNGTAVQQKMLLRVTNAKGDIIKIGGASDAASSSGSGSRFRTTVGLGATFLGFDQTGLTHYSETGLTGKASLQYALPPSRWDFGVTAFMTLLTLKSSVPGIDARFLGINARAGYTLAGVHDPWKLSLLGGIYYTTMLVTGDAFGVQNLFGPQFMPVLSRTIGPRDGLSTYLKFAPVTGSASSLSLGNREIATGLSWRHQYASRYALIFSVDLADIRFQDAAQLADAKSLSFGVSAQW